MKPSHSPLTIVQTHRITMMSTAPQCQTIAASSCPFDSDCRPARNHSKETMIPPIHQNRGHVLPNSSCVTVLLSSLIESKAGHSRTHLLHARVNRCCDWYCCEQERSRSLAF